MNRYIGAGLLAALAVLIGSGLDNVGAILPRFGSDESRVTPPVGTQPIEQAGKVVRRQGETVGTVPTAPFPSGSEMIQGTNVPTQNGLPAQDGTQPTPNVIPRTTGVAPATTTTGDVAPIQEDLVRSGASDLPEVDEGLDSIPALW
jgi:hypothetical protein